MELAEDLRIPEIGEIVDRLDSGADALYLTGLFGASKALILSQIARRSGRPLVVVTSSSAEAELLAKDLQVFFRDSVGVMAERDEDPETGYQRITCLTGLATKNCDLAVVCLQAALERLAPPSAILGAAFTLYVGRLIARDELVGVLETGGYRRVHQTTDRGEYSLRGNLLDLFPLTPSLNGSTGLTTGRVEPPDCPVRAEFFGDEILELRAFDPATQRSIGSVEQVTVLPVVEAPLTGEVCRRALEVLRAMKKTRDSSVPSEIITALEDRRQVLGLDTYLPYFYPEPADLLQYVAPDALWVLIDPTGLRAAARDVAPSTSLVDWSDVEQRLSLRPRIYMEEFLPTNSLAEEATLGFQVRTIPAYRGRMTELIRDLQEWRRQGRKIHLVCRSEAQGGRLAEVLREHDVAASVGLGVASPGEIAVLSHELSSGFHLDEALLTYITEAEIFGARHIPPRRLRPKEISPLASYQELTYGDFVVHEDHGIGVYKGLRQLTVGGTEGDYLLILYAEHAKLYVPTGKLHLIHRYAGADSNPPTLDRLGSASWAKAKERVKASVREMAQELLALYASRQVIKGHALPPDTPWQREFEAGFPYEETPDQLQAIADVKADMERDRPMDRLICGDVGYGKTEVAMRAAFKTIIGGKQVAVLVPTTVLALQHFQTFSERFGGFPAKVEMLSRFRSRKEQSEVLRGVGEGVVDIVIGTHRLLQKDVRFRDLGLLVVDEEHRFGVAAKERMKQLRRQVDVLTLTATPIPRTLHMSMLGVRDISTIETAPDNRLSIKTTVARFDPALIKEAIEHELDRGGQVFFVHNRVESIQGVARLIKQLVPEARLAVAHGELPEERLERIMCDFYDGTFNVLLCTTIIESGLDVSAANTIIIDRADALGLAQLYQLRGRVGRDKHRAYAYLLVPKDAALSETAKKRLQVIAELTELGSGFKVAARDLEIRGTGNLLGPEQHGQIAAVGIDLYCRLIESTVKELKGQAVAEPVEPVIRLEAEGYLPEIYIEDSNVRLQLYKRLAAFSGLSEVSALREELVDRFGEPPPETERLLTAMALRILARTLHIREAVVVGKTIRIVFDESPPLAPDKVATLLREEGGRLRYIPKSSHPSSTKGGPVGGYRTGYDELEYKVEGGDKIAIAQTLLSRLQACR
ncbi:Transcription-repair-coupling factor (TRCF) (ATP-dependent helicase mfd) [Candidatus Methylomirabilis oxygeniifera]|uniref:Transcription-repair-coupling factor n=1 Tax=Methylomirabilis oxygeniifera TaxID=671143 RepID=D5MJM2_METO1|nr:Transcription-repair-coupling factor (TRCF) (ATP-dependent helicase mfd) [Candidatus Methylomirabilis oxyfera]